MKKIEIKELRYIHEWVRNCSPQEVLFVALLLFPIIILMYGEVIIALSLEQYMIYILGLASILYAASIICMKIYQGNKEKYEVDLNILINRSCNLQNEYISFKSLSDFDKRYSEKYIRKLIRYAPSEITISKLKGNEKGIKFLKYIQHLAL